MLKNIGAAKDITIDTIFRMLNSTFKTVLLNECEDDK